MIVINRELALRIFKELLNINKANTRKYLNKQLAEVEGVVPKKIEKKMFKNEKKKKTQLTIRIHFTAISRAKITDFCKKYDALGTLIGCW